jgi:hypothetical protein
MIDVIRTGCKLTLYICIYIQPYMHAANYKCSCVDDVSMVWDQGHLGPS